MRVEHRWPVQSRVSLGRVAKLSLPGALLRVLGGGDQLIRAPSGKRPLCRSVNPQKRPPQETAPNSGRAVGRTSGSPPNMAFGP